MARKTKCRFCMISDDKEKIKENKKFFHIEDCYEKHKKKQEFLENERKQKNELTAKIIKLHGLNNSQEIPTLFYMKIEEIRNDSVLIGRVNKKYKQGLPYSSISYTYDYCSKNIEWALLNKQFKTKLEEMSYCLGIVKNNFADAYRDAVNKQKQKLNQEKIQKQVHTEYVSTVSHEYVKPKKDDLDISDYL